MKYFLFILILIVGCSNQKIEVTKNHLRAHLDSTSDVVLQNQLRAALREIEQTNPRRPIPFRAIIIRRPKVYILNVQWFDDAHRVTGMELVFADTSKTIAYDPYHVFPSEGFHWFDEFSLNKTARPLESHPNGRDRNIYFAVEQFREFVDAAREGRAYLRMLVNTGSTPFDCRIEYQDDR